MSILVVGSVALDTVKTPLGEVKDALGGSATYFSVSASSFSPVNLVAVVGNDFPAKYINFLKNKGVDLGGLTAKKGKTFRWKGEYKWDFGDPKTISTCLNVFSDFNPKIPEKYTNSKYLFLANIDPQIQERILRQVAKPKLIACDTMNYWIENKRSSLLKVLKKVDIFLLNESEARELSGQTHLLKASKSIAKIGPKVIIIKKGEHGALLFSKKYVFCVPAFLLESIVDPTGAGDTFAGGVIGYLASTGTFNQADLKKAIVYGSVMATFAVESFSLKRLGTISRKNINSRFEEFKKRVCF